MLRLDLTAEPRWLDLGRGVRLHAAPLTTVLMVAARNDAAVDALPASASDEEQTIPASTSPTHPIRFMASLRPRIIGFARRVGATRPYPY